MINVFIIDDHYIVRKGLKQILSDENDIGVIGEASSSNEITGEESVKNWDVLVLDIAMPGRNGLDALIELKDRFPFLKILILSMYSEDEIILRALKTGADGYLTKDCAPEELVKAIREIYSGRKYIGVSISKKIMESLLKGDKEDLTSQLSEREYQVFCLLASGHSLTTIAGELSISIKTVSTYRTRIMEKFHLKSNIDLVLYAMKHKLVVPVYNEIS